MVFWRFLGQNYPLYRILNIWDISLFIFDNLSLEKIRKKSKYLLRLKNDRTCTSIWCFRVFRKLFVFCRTKLLKQLLIFRYDRFSGEPYIFTRVKIVTLKKLEIYCIKTIFRQESVHFRRFLWCMYVRSYLIKFMNYLSEFSIDLNEFWPRYSSNCI